MKVLPGTTLRPTFYGSPVSRGQRGSGIVEVVFCVGLVSIVCIAATTGLGRSISEAFTDIAVRTGGGFEGMPLPNAGRNGGETGGAEGESAGGGEGEGW